MDYRLTELVSAIADKVTTDHCMYPEDGWPVAIHADAGRKIVRVKISPKGALDTFTVSLNGANFRTSERELAADMIANHLNA